MIRDLSSQRYVVVGKDPGRIRVWRRDGRDRERSSFRLPPYFPWNFGFRFSMNAVRPSLKSALEKQASDIFFSLS